MSNWGSADFIITGDGELSSFVAPQVPNCKGEAQLKNDLQSDQTPKCVVVSLLGRGKVSCDQGNGDKAGCAGPESRKNREPHCPIKPKHLSYPVTNTCNNRCLQLKRRNLR